MWMPTAEKKSREGKQLCERGRWSQDPLFGTGGTECGRETNPHGT